MSDKYDADKLAELRKEQRIEELKNTKRRRNAIFLWAITMIAVILLVIAIVSRMLA